MRTLKMREAGEMGNEVRRGWAGSTIDKRLVFRSSLYEKKTLFFSRGAYKKNNGCKAGGGRVPPTKRETFWVKIETFFPSLKRATHNGNTLLSLCCTNNILN